MRAGTRSLASSFRIIHVGSWWRVFVWLVRSVIPIPSSIAVAGLRIRVRLLPGVIVWRRHCSRGQGYLVVHRSPRNRLDPWDCCCNRGRVHFVRYGAGLAIVRPTRVGAHLRHWRILLWVTRHALGPEGQGSRWCRIRRPVHLLPGWWLGGDGSRPRCRRRRSMWCVWRESRGYWRLGRV